MRDRRIGSLIAGGLAVLVLWTAASRAGSIFDDDWKPAKREQPRQELPPVREEASPPATQPGGEAPGPRPVSPASPASAPVPPPAVAAPIPPAGDRANSRKLLKEAFADKLFCVINGIYWWPQWHEKMRSDVFPMTDLWPKDPSRFQLLKSEAKRGEVKLLQRSGDEISIEFRDKGFGSSQVGCIVGLGNP